MPKLLIYSNSASFRERVRMAIGTSPAAGVDDIDYVEVGDSYSVNALVDRGGIDLLVLDGEAWPAGGMGVARELKNSRRVSPPIIVVIGRNDDRWLAKWSQADAAIVEPVDHVELTNTVVSLLRGEPVGAGTTKETL
jgi:DNA-binding response OmpR family regulator